HLMSLSIVTFKWKGSKGFRNEYTADHVNRLAEMLQRNTTVKYDFYCVTDDPTGIREDVKVVPLWDNPAPHYGGTKRPNCFARLKVFSEEAKQLFGERVVWMDLDVLILGNIDNILRDKSDLKLWYVDGEISPCNGSLVMHKLGTRTALWTKFNPQDVDAEDGYQHRGFVGSDQAWIAQNLTPQDLRYGKVDGVYSYRCHLKGKPLPADVKMVFFHGDDKADDLMHVGWIRRALRQLELPADVAALPAERRIVPREKLRVVTWLWRAPPGKPPLFSAECVNTMQSMVDRYYRKPYEMVCVTDDPRGIDGSVRTIPLWNDFSYLDHPQLGAGFSTCYKRLRMFAPEMADIISPRFVSVDLDAVILADLAPLWDRKEDFVGWNPGVFWSPYNGSMTLLTAGARKQVWEKFDPHRTPQEAKEAQLIGTDQAVVAHILGAGEKTWTDQDGVWAFRNLGYTGDRPRDIRRQEREFERQQRRDRGRERFERDARREARAAARKALPTNTRIVFFPGALKPWMPDVFNYFHWVRKGYKQEAVNG